MYDFNYFTNIVISSVLKFDVHVTMHRVKFLIIKPTRCTNFPTLFLEWNSTCFGQFLCTSSGVFHCIHSNGICHTDLLTAFEQDQDGTAVPFWSCSKSVSKPVWHIPLLRVQRKTPDDGQRNCPKDVVCYSKNKFEKLVHPVGFIIRSVLKVVPFILYDVTTTEIQLTFRHRASCILGQAFSILSREHFLYI